MIRTPDQRLRVFISSTIQELSEERLEARKAIEELRLIPVLFEIGARPYPPRDVYQAYLAQSDIFIGIYWNSYGWIAPDMDISGLEDEYRLSGDKLRLIYIKKSDARQERLEALINDISAAGVSYKYFEGPQNLKELIENDLALLLSEQFHKDSSRASADTSVFNIIPNPYHALIGRETEMSEIMTQIRDQKSRLVTILGMGGTGKTRLAIELAQQLFPHFRHGVAFISLASTNDSTRLPSTLAHHLGLTDSSAQSVTETLISFLYDKHLLLILDNFEQLIEGAELLSKILARAKEVYMLVTSRRPLYQRAEHIYPLQPLALPLKDYLIMMERVLEVPSVSLFIQRARSVNPRLQLDIENLKAICILCERLGGLPLTLELAAMRTRYMTPTALLKGMEKTLDILSDGARDLPDRQQSFRATIDWSYDLLAENEKSLFRIASVFQDGWTMEALIAVSNISSAECRKSSEQLLDAGLIRMHIDDHGKMRYDMLQPIEEFAEELFANDENRITIEGRFLDYFIQLSAQGDSLQLSTKQIRDWVAVVIKEYENFRYAFDYAVKSNRQSEACQIIYTVGIYWFREGFQNECLRWMKDANIQPPEKWNTLPQEDIRRYAMVMLVSGSFKFFPADFIPAKNELLHAREMFEWLGQEDGVARCNMYLGLLAISTGDPQGLTYFQEAIEKGNSCGDIFSVLLSTTFIAEVYAVQGLLAEAVKSVENAEQILKTHSEIRSSLERDNLVAIVFLEKGNVLFAKGDFIEAKVAIERSLEYFEKANSRSTKGYAVLSLGFIHLINGDLDGARQYAFQALNESRETGDKIISLISMRALCAYLLWKGQYDLSMKYLQEVDAHLHQLNYSSWSADIIMLSHIRAECEKRNLEYTFVPRSPVISFDELVVELSKEAG